MITDVRLNCCCGNGLTCPSHGSPKNKSYCEKPLSDTPETDSNKKICGSFNRGTHEYVSVEFSRKLEKERDEARRELVKFKNMGVSEL